MVVVKNNTCLLPDLGSEVSKSAKYRGGKNEIINDRKAVELD